MTADEWGSSDDDSDDSERRQTRKANTHAIDKAEQYEANIKIIIERVKKQGYELDHTRIIPEFPDYTISPDGTLIKTKTGRIISFNYTENGGNNGIFRYALTKNKKQYQRSIASLMMATFPKHEVEKPEPKHEEPTKPKTQRVPFLEQMKDKPAKLTRSSSSDQMSKN